MIKEQKILHLSVIQIEFLVQKTQWPYLLLHSSCVNLTHVFLDVNWWEESMKLSSDNDNGDVC
jgi:hypothetical protein